MGGSPLCSFTQVSHSVAEGLLVPLATSQQNYVGNRHIFKGCAAWAALQHSVFTKLTQITVYVDDAGEYIREERDIFRGSLKKLTLKTDLIKSPKTATETLTVYGWHTQLQQWQLSAHISDANDWMAVEMWHVCSLEEQGEVACLKLKADRRLLSLKTISWLQGHENGRLWGHQSVRVKRWWESTE